MDRINREEFFIGDTKMQICPKCGGNKSRGLITCPQFPAPEGSLFKSQSICMSHCSSCEFFRKDDDVSNIWCRYRIENRKLEQVAKAEPQEEQQSNEIRNIYALINYKKKQAENYYKTGKPRIAEKIEHEIMALRKEHGINDQTVNQKEKTAL
jgi:hypothetical protein